MPLSPGELYDALTAALDRAPALAWLTRAPVIWLTRPHLTIGERSWKAAAGDPGAYGYTWRQARQMRRTLLQVMADAESPLEDLIRRHGGTFGLR